MDVLGFRGGEESKGAGLGEVTAGGFQNGRKAPMADSEAGRQPKEGDTRTIMIQRPQTGRQPLRQTAGALSAGERGGAVPSKGQRQDGQTTSPQSTAILRAMEGEPWDPGLPWQHVLPE